MKRGHLVVAASFLLIITTVLLPAPPAHAVRASRLASSAVHVFSKRVSAYAAAEHTVNLETLAVNNTKPAVRHRSLPLIVSPKLAAAKAAVPRNAPKALASGLPAAAARSSVVGFQGMSDSATICPYFGGCQPPDMALATSPTRVLQGVNTSYAIYNTTGQLVEGPINDQTWYGVPNPPNNCDPAGPFLTDPRAFYDPNSGLFWTATLQIEGSTTGVGVNCPNLSKYWIANLNVATGVMHVYSFDMTLGGTVNDGADYTQFGFSNSTVTFTGNMFNFTTGNYDFAEAQFADKSAMERGLPVTPVAFTQLGAAGASGTVLVDTVQPAQTETTPANDPSVQYLVNSFNMNGDPLGDDCFFTACQGFVVWAYDPASHALNGTYVGTAVPNPTYISPPEADQPGCLQCVETIDTRITGTPVYSVGGGEGLISFALDTAVSNGGPASVSVVPGILWGQIQVTHFGASPTGNLDQSGYLAFSGDRAASFGAMMQDRVGKLFMVFDTMSANLNPSIMIASRDSSAPLGTIGNVSFLVKGPSATFNTRWGDFEAASYTGFSSNHVWVASQYSVSGDWTTFISRVS